MTAAKRPRSADPATAGPPPLQKLRVEIDQLAASEHWHIALTGAFYDGEVDQARRIVQDASNAMPVVSMLDDVLAPATAQLLVGGAATRNLQPGFLHTTLGDSTVFWKQ
jgi:hypothetical protein